MQIRLAKLKENDLTKVKEIYDYYILNSTATFHTHSISTKELKSFIPLNNQKYPSYLILLNEKYCGYCYISQYKNRQAYDRTAEVTVYLKPEYTGKGIGKKVIFMLEEIALKNGISVLIGGITAKNIGSIRLFEGCGFEKCSHLKQVGEKFGEVLDVVYYQKIIRPLSGR